MEHTRNLLLAFGACLTIGTWAQTPTDVSITGVAAIDELNTVGTADAYPWISADGLRLYFTQEQPSDDMLMLATRATVNDAFGPAEALLPLEAIEQVSCWLSADELTMWFTSSSSVRKCVRATIADPFGTSVLVTLNGFSGFVKSPTLTPDEQQMIVYGAGDIYVLNKTGTDTYTQVGPLTTGAPNTGPMKMSNDGLTIWFGADFNGVRIPHRMTRSSTTGNFNGLQYFAGNEFNSAYGWFHPHVTPDGSIMVGTRGSNGLWSGNDLFIADGESTASISDEAHWLDAGLVYPNPASNVLNVRMPEGWTEADVRVIDADGRLRMTDFVRSTGQCSVNVADLAAGLYTIQLANGTRRVTVRAMVQR